MLTLQHCKIPSLSIITPVQCLIAFELMDLLLTPVFLDHISLSHWYLKHVCRDIFCVYRFLKDKARIILFHFILMVNKYYENTQMYLLLTIFRFPSQLLGIQFKVHLFLINEKLPGSIFVGACSQTRVNSAFAGYYVSSLVFVPPEQYMKNLLKINYSGCWYGVAHRKNAEYHQPHYLI